MASRLSGLKRRARTVALSNGHVLGPFRRMDGHQLSTCVRCEAFVSVSLNPREGEQPIMGEALTTRCRGHK
jgi:hypothetical protein